MYVTLPSPRSVLISQSFHHPQLKYFAILLKKEKISERFVKKVTPTPLPPPRHSRKILKDLAKMSQSYLSHHKKYFEHIVFCKIWSKENNAYLSPQTTSPPTPSLT